MLRRPQKRKLAMEHLEARDVPASLVFSSYFDAALYQVDSDTGALQETLVAPHSSALLAGISGVAAGPDGNLYLSSQAGPAGNPSNSIVRFNYANRTLSTFISSAVLQQIATANGEANFAPAGLTFGTDGNLYVVMNGGRGVAGTDGVVRFKIDATANGLLYGNQATVVGSGSLFSEPTMLAFGAGADSSSLYVSSGLTGTVVKISGASGSTPSSAEFIAAGAGGLNYPSGLTWGPNGDLYVTDLAATGARQGQILAFNADGSFDSVYAGGGSFGTAGSLQFQFPSAAVFDGSGNLYTANLGPAYPQSFGGSGMQGSIFKYGSSGAFTSALVTSASYPAGPSGDSGIAPSQLVFFGSPPVVPPPPTPTTPSSVIAVSGVSNGAATVIQPNASGVYSPTPLAFVNPFAGYSVAVHTATGDVDGDGVDDYIVATGAGVPTLVAVMNGADPFTYLVAPFSPFPGSETFSGGAFVASGDINGDGFAEIVVSPDQGGGARVTIWSMPPSGFALLKNFMAFSDPNFRGGARVAVGDVNHDGTIDLGVAAGIEGGPRVSIYSGATLLGNQTEPGTAQEPIRIANFYAFDGPDIQRLRNGVFLALGDIDGDGFADAIVGAGPGGAPRVSILNGALISSGQLATANPIANFFVAGNDSDRGGVRVAVKNADGDAKQDLVIGSGEGSPSRVRTYLGSSFTTTAEPAVSQDIDPFGTTLPGGVFVG